MTNLIERLRGANKFCGTLGASICNEAASALEQAQTEVTRLQRILMRMSNACSEIAKEELQSVEYNDPVLEMIDPSWADDGSDPGDS